MENQSVGKTIRDKFRTPLDEIEYVRSEAMNSGEISGVEDDEKTDVVIADSLKKYRFNNPEEVLDTDYRIGGEEVESIVLDLSPEPHDAKIESLIQILQEKGLRNTLSVLDKMNDSHLNDDFHRFLVQYVKAGFPVKDLKEKTPQGKAVKMTLFEISLPDVAEDDKDKELKRLISGMEQFYAGMLSVGSESDYFSIEIANANGSDEFIFYASVPDNKKDLFEKQILSIFHSAKVVECKDDYNIFNESGYSAGSYAFSGGNPVLPIKLYDEFDIDPLNVILNSFSKLDRDGEGASIQFLFSPASEVYISRYREALSQLKKGVPKKKALDVPVSWLGDLRKAFKDVVSADDKSKSKDKGERTNEKLVDESVVEEVTKKVSSPIIISNIRIIASAGDKGSAEEILSDIEASFNQFTNTQGNNLKFKRLEGGKFRKMANQYSWRIFDTAIQIPLNIKELTTMMHFPSAPVKSSSQLRHSKAGTAPAPIELPDSGLLIGVNKYRGTEKNIFVSPEDRLRHFYVIGQTGTGKTTLLKNMIAQDIKNGEGVCLIDPHGSDIQDILSVVPKERYEDVIYFDPSYTERPMALNMLEYDIRYPEQKTFVVNEMLSIFDKLFDMKTAGGPMFEQYFRNAVMLTIEDPETGSTLLDVSRVLSNKSFRELKLSKCKNPIVVQFWREVAEKAGGEASLQNIVPYITSKFDNFLSNDIMRPIVSQEKSSFNFREIMDNKKILLVNLAKGRLGDINSNLIGLILVGKILMASFSRTDSNADNLAPFYLYIDEFQNVTTPSISTILSEARKYKLSLNIAHQFIGQLEEPIKDSVFGNVGSISAFRVGTEDAEFLAKQFEPVFTSQDLMNLDNRNAYMKLLADGRPVKPFNIETNAPPVGNKEQIEKLKELSYLTFGREREEVEAEIMAKYETMLR